MAQRKRKKEAKQAENQAGKLGEAVKAIMEGLQPMAQSAGQNGQTTQLVKSRWPPAWSGQSLKKLIKEVEKRVENNKSTKEDKFVDLMESLKKNKTIKLT